MEDEDFAIEPDPYEDDEEFDVETPAPVSDFAVQPSLSPDDISSVYTQAAQLLRQQRRGLSTKEKLGALLVGFGQPTRSGKWQEALAHGASSLAQHSLSARAEEEKRREQLAGLLMRSKLADRANASRREIAEIGAKSRERIAREKLLAAGQGGKLNADETKRLGYAQRLWPTLARDELIKRLYEPGVENLMIKGQVAAGAAQGGFDATEYMTPPEGYTTQDFLDYARNAIAKGAKREAVIGRLRQWGIPVEGL